MVLGLQNNTLGGSSSSLVSDGFAVRYDAATDAYVIDLPSAEPGRFRSDVEDSRYWAGSLTQTDGQSTGWEVTIFKPLPTNPDLALQYTTFGTFDDHYGFYDYDYNYDDVPAGVFAFGIPTPAGSVPTTGSATFDAIVRGLTLDTSTHVGGTASLQFNFGAGTLAGSVNPYTFDANGGQVSLGTYNFVNTVFGIGSTTFSGQLQHSGLSGLGAFNGLFTGPAAQELMARWTAPYLNPDTSQQAEMFGVWVGRRP